MTVQWWCSARGIPWKWRWTPYPGVWIAVIALGDGVPALVVAER